MSNRRTSVSERVEALYRAAAQDLDMSAIIAGVDSGDDDELAEMIETDGRLRITMARPVDLRRYLDAVPELTRRVVALDAAIDVTLRYRSGGARPTARAVQTLVEEYPGLRDAIGDAALLADAVVSTAGVRRIVREAPQRKLPADFGPAIGSGHRRYQLTKLLGSGSAGDVYQAIDRQLTENDRPAYVAIKLLTGQERSQRARQHLIDEASKARRVLHDNVVRVLDRGVSDQDEDYIVYEHVEGGDLDEWFKSNHWKVAPGDAARMAAGIARGVQAAHSAGLVHCDLKPSNVLITSQGVPKVCDFGIAVRESDLRRNGPGPAKPVGNIAFISPEQYRAEEGSLSPPSDVYALGGILYYLLTHQLPNGDSIDAVAQAHDPISGRKAAPDPRSLDRMIDFDLSTICRRAMSAVPSERHVSAAALAEDLDAWGRREPIAWMRPSLWKVAKLAARRRPAVALAWAFTILAVLGGVGAGGYWASVATKSKEVARVADDRMTSARVELGQILRTFRTLKKQGLGMDLVPLVVALETVFGRTVLGSVDDRNALWAERNSAVRELIDENTLSGHGSDVETLFWESILGFWLMNDGKFREAEEVLASSARKWALRDNAGDPMPVQVRLLAAAATARRLIHDAKGGPMAADERDELITLEAELRTEAEAFIGRAAASPMRGHVLRALVELYKPAALNRVNELRDVQRKLSKIEAH